MILLELGRGYKARGYELPRPLRQLCSSGSGGIESSLRIERGRCVERHGQGVRNGCCENNSPMGPGLCPRERFRCNCTLSRADSRTAGINSFPTGDRAELRWHARNCPSPSGRRWPEGPDEGTFLPSRGASRHPLPKGPKGEGHSRNSFQNREPMKTECVENGRRP